VRSATAVRLTDHHVVLDERSEDLEHLLAAIGGEHATAPPTVKDLQTAGHGRDVVDAAARAGWVVRVSPQLIFTPEVIARATSTVRDAGAAGVTVSAFREAMGTSRKYAVPLLEWLDQQGITERRGDLRFTRDP
jgi:selenocysteine-specific elongation factor